MPLMTFLSLIAAVLAAAGASLALAFWLDLPLAAMIPLTLCAALLVRVGAWR